MMANLSENTIQDNQAVLVLFSSEVMISRLLIVSMSISAVSLVATRDRNRGFSQPRGKALVGQLCSEYPFLLSLMAAITTIYMMWVVHASYIF